MHVVVPARLASTRLPGKPLAPIAGIPMIVRVMMAVQESGVDSIIAAVDDSDVLAVVEAAGFNAMLTREDHPSGSDRVMEVVARLGWDDADIVINVQGDEPLLPASLVTQLAELMRADVDMEMATVAEPIATTEDFLNPNIVKVVTTTQGNALYFSRAPIPLPRDLMLHNALTDSQIANFKPQRHVGLYAFRVHALRKFVALRDARLEDIEALEQLRWLEAGGSIRVLASAVAVPGGVDTPEDLARVEQILLAR
ncbi:MAG: 3-deoxy-manno-octulosonate cytidylyltransferase [bacterium]